MVTTQPLEVSEFGRPVVYQVEWSWYGGKATGSCLYSTAAEAIKDAVFQAEGFVDWSNFPDPAKTYPYDDRDGSGELSPFFAARWDGGFAQVSRLEVADTAAIANPSLVRVNQMIQQIKQKREK